MMMSLGFDPQKGRFVGTFIGSMMTHLWIYDGALDASGKALILDAEGPNCTGAADGKLAKYQDIIEWQSDDHRVLRSRMLGEDGTWRSSRRRSTGARGKASIPLPLAGKVRGLRRMPTVGRTTRRRSQSRLGAAAGVDPVPSDPPPRVGAAEPIPGPHRARRAETRRDAP